MKYAFNVFPLNAMYGPHFSGDKFSPLIKNINEPRNLVKVHMCKFCRGPRRPSCWMKLHQAFCMAPKAYDRNGLPKRNAEGHIIICGEGFTPSSPRGCSQHPFSDGFNKEFTMVQHGIELTEIPWYLKDYDIRIGLKPEVDDAEALLAQQCEEVIAAGVAPDLFRGKDEACSSKPRAAFDFGEVSAALNAVLDSDSFRSNAHEEARDRQRVLAAMAGAKNGKEAKKIMATMARVEEMKKLRRDELGRKVAEEASRKAQKSKKVEVGANVCKGLVMGKSHRN